MEGMRGGPRLSISERETNEVGPCVSTGKENRPEWAVYKGKRRERPWVGKEIGTKRNIWIFVGFLNYRN